MDEKDLDIFLPEEAADSTDVTRREAIAQARAIRREAAAKEESRKQEAAAEANAILKNAESEPVVQRDFSDNTLSSLFGQLRTPIRSAHRSETPSPEPDAESIVAQIMAEVTGNAEVSDDTPEYTGKRSDPDTDALVDQIIAEVTAKRDADRNEQSDSDARIDRIIAETAPSRANETAEHSEEESRAEEHAPEMEPEDPLTAATDEAIAEGDEDAINQAVEQIAERAAQLAKSEHAPAPVPETPKPAPEVRKPEPAKKTDPLAPAFAAEDLFTRERQRAIDHSEEMEEAAEQYAEDTAGAKRAVKKLTKQSDRTWKKEAAREQAKRHSGRSAQITAAINFTVCAVMFFGIAVGMVVLERPTVSVEENRNLATMPEFSVEDYFNGDYTAGVAEYYNDTVPFRSVFKNLTAEFRQHLGIRGEAVLHGNASVIQDNPEPEVTLPAVTTAPEDDPGMAVTTTQAAETTAPAQSTEPAKQEDGELSNSILIYQKRAISLFQAGEKQGAAYAGYLNNYQRDLGSGVQVYSLVAPTACSFYTPDNFKKMITSEQANIEYMNSCFEGVKPVDAYGALAKHTDEPIFMRTDHHWGSIGAFYAAEEFSKTARVPFARITDYEKIVKPGYVGTMYGYSGDKILKDNPEDFIYYIPKAQFKTTFFNRSVQNGYEGNFFMNIDKAAPVNWYMVYMSGDDHVVRLNTEVKNGRRLVIIKDSYGNALVPWLTSSFEQIDVIDMRYFNKNAISYIKEIGATDVLFAMNTFSANSGNGKKVEQIRKQ